MPQIYWRCLQLLQKKNVYLQFRHFLSLKKINNSRAELPSKWLLQKMRASRRKAWWGPQGPCLLCRAELPSPVFVGASPCSGPGPVGSSLQLLFIFPSLPLADSSPSPPYLCPFLCFSFQLIPSCFSPGPFCVTYTHTLFYSGKLI